MAKNHPLTEIAALTTTSRCWFPDKAEAFAIFHQLIFDGWASGTLDNPPATIKVDGNNSFGLIVGVLCENSASSLLPEHAAVAGWKHPALSFVEQHGVQPMPEHRGAELRTLHTCTSSRSRGTSQLTWAAFSLRSATFCDGNMVTSQNSVMATPFSKSSYTRSSGYCNKLGYEVTDTHTRELARRLTIRDIPCGISYSETFSSKNTQLTLTPSPPFPISLQQPTYLDVPFRLTSTASQTSMAAQVFSALLWCRDSTVSPNNETLTFETFSSESFAPLSRPTTPHNLVATTLNNSRWRIIPLANRDLTCVPLTKMIQKFSIGKILESWHLSGLQFGCLPFLDPTVCENQKYHVDCLEKACMTLISVNKT